MSAERSPHQVAVSEAMKRHWRKRKAAAASPPPLRLVAPTPPEAELHASVAAALDYLLLPPATWTTFPAGNVPLPPQHAAKLSRIGLKRCWPDVLLVYRGEIFGIELKREGAGLSRTRWGRTARGTLREYEGQDRVFPKLEAAGMRIAVCRSSDDVIDQLAQWGIPMRRAA